MGYQIRTNIKDQDHSRAEVTKLTMGEHDPWPPTAQFKPLIAETSGDLSKPSFCHLKMGITTNSLDSFED